MLQVDRQALKWIFKSADLYAQNARWVETLSNYKFEIQHRSGSLHGNADSLSRFAIEQATANQSNNTWATDITPVYPLTVYEQSGEGRR